MTEPEANPRAAEQRMAAARSEARRAAWLLAVDAGATTVARPLYPGAETTIKDVESLAGARAARDLEVCARTVARDYLRQAREAGCDWDQISQTLGLSPKADADQAGLNIPEAAFTYAAGHPDTNAPWHPRSFPWTCRTCDHVINDRGLATARPTTNSATPMAAPG
jgi:hypothetical protein